MKRGAAWNPWVGSESWLISMRVTGVVALIMGIRCARPVWRRSPRRMNLAASPKEVGHAWSPSPPG